MSYILGAAFGGAALMEMFYCLFGLIYGYITVAFRGWYEAQFAAESAAPAAQKACAWAFKKATSKEFKQISMPAKK